MSNPQKENGYTAIANELMDQFCLHFPRGATGQVLLAILRKIYGWNKKEDKISIGQLIAMTGVSRRAVIYALNDLESRRFIEIVREKVSRINETNIIRFNKKYSEWQTDKIADEINGKKAIGRGSAKLGNKGVVQNSVKGEGGSAKLGNKVVQNTVNEIPSFAPTKDTTTKAITKTNKQKKAKASTPSELVSIPTDEDIKNAKTPQAKLALYFSKRYYENTGFPYILKKQDYCICEKLLKRYDKQIIFNKIGMLEVYCSGKVDVWFASNGWGDFTIGKLMKVWNSILPKLTKKQKEDIDDRDVLKKYEEHERRMRELLAKKGNA